MLALALVITPALATQATLVTPGSPLPMTGLASFLNSALLSVGSCNSGNSAPANGTGGAAFAGECWINTAANPWVFSYTADGTHWTQFGALNTSTFVWTAYSTGWAATLGGNLTTAGSLTTAGAYGATMTFTGTTNATFPAGTHTLGALDVSQTWSATNNFTGPFEIGGYTASLGGNLATAAAFTQAGAFATTLTSTGITNATLPAGTHTLAGLDVSQTWSGTNNFTGPVQISGTAQTFPASGSLVGTSDSQTLTNKTFNCANNTCTVRIASDVTGLGSGVATALGVAIGSAGAPVVYGGALGSPSSVGTLPAFTLGGTVSGGGNAINNVAIGSVSPGAGAFTNLSSSGTVSGTGFSTYLASPPAIGGTAAAAGSFTNLSSSGTVSGTGFSSYLASPPAIGGTTPNTGAFASLTLSTALSVANGGTGLTSLTSGAIYKGNGTSAPTASALTDNGSVVKTSEPFDLGSQPQVVEIANAGTTGTTLNALAKLTGAPSTAVITATTDTGGVVGIVTGGAGTTGNAQIATGGTASCIFDGATTAGDYVQISTSTAGDCHDVGSSYPSSGQIIGRVLSTNASGGTYAVSLNDEIRGGSGGGGGLSSVTIAPGTGMGTFTGTCNSTSSINCTINMSSPLPTANGGSGVASPTANTIPVNQGASPQTNVALAAGQFLSGATPAATSGPWTLLATLTASSSTSLSDTSHITSTYSDYEIVFDNLIPASGSSNYGFLLVHSGGSFQTTSYVTSGFLPNGTAVVSDNPTTYIPLNHGAASTSGPGFNGRVLLHTPSTSALHSIEGLISYYSSAIVPYTVTGYWNSAAAIDGFEFCFGTSPPTCTSSGIASGSIKIYGRL